MSDAVDVQEGPVTTQSVFAGNFTVKAGVSKGVPVIAVRPGGSGDPYASLDVVERAAAAAERAFAVAELPDRLRAVEFVPFRASAS